MMSKIAKMLAVFGGVLATIGSQACILVVLDEPECPQVLIK